MAGEQILLVEDDERIGSTLVRALEGSGYRAEWVRSGADAFDAAQRLPPALVLLDLGLPDLDGLDVCRALLDADPAIIVVMLTARDEELDIVVGLDAGAVDYVPKPFRLAELMARIRAQLRQNLSPPAPSRTGDLRIDESSRRVSLGDEPLELRAKEFDLLARLVRDVGQVVSRETLMSDVWDENWFGSTKTLDFHIAALRRKLDPDDGPSRITTIRGVGFRLEAP